LQELRESQGILWSNGKTVPDDIPAAWRLLDDTRFYLLEQATGGELPSSSALYSNRVILQSYQLLSTAASDVWAEYLRTPNSAHPSARQRNLCLCAGE
jgi:hypothetical protein